MKRLFAVFTAVGALALGAPDGRADDKWEVSSPFCNDDASSTICNQLVHGARQTHDSQAVSPARDEDWYIVETKARHSYEARVSSGSTLFGTGSTTGAGSRMNRVNAGGAVLTPPIAPDGTIHYSDGATHIAVRWIGAGNQRDYIRFEGQGFGNPGANNQYDIEFFDTTFFFSRWNNAGTQTTVLLIQNASAAVVTGDIYFYNAAGTLLATQPLNVPIGGLQAVGTASIPALVGNSGSGTIAHTGGYGALVGKAVALEPATGFTFDTPLAPLPR